MILQTLTLILLKVKIFYSIAVLLESVDVLIFGQK